MNVISPGTIYTPALDPLGPDAKAMFASLVPRGEIGRPAEIATAALFLASGDSVSSIARSCSWTAELHRFKRLRRRSDQ